MAKMVGKIGYSITSETEAGIWEPQIIEKTYCFDVISDRRKRQNSDAGINDNIHFSSIISIISDPFVIQNCSYITYAEVMGTRWKVTDIEVKYPRLKLTLGGVYNGNTLSVTE